MNIEADAARALGWFENHVPGRRHTSAESPAAAVTIGTTPGGTMSMLAEAKNILHDGLAKLETVDEDALNVIEAIKPSPVAVSITNTLAGIAHLPDPGNALGAVDAILKTVAAGLAAGVAATAPAAAAQAPAQDSQPATAPSGPQVGGQA